MRVSLTRLLAAAALCGLVVLAAAPAALATAQTRSQNPALTVRAVLRSNNATDPNTAAVGDTVTARGAVTNNTDHFLLANVKLTLTLPDGTSKSLQAVLPLAAGQKVSKSLSFVDQPWMPTGTYTLRIAATDSNGTSHATATITLI